MLRDGEIEYILGDDTGEVQTLIEGIVSRNISLEDVDPMPLTDEVRGRILSVQAGLADDTKQYWRDFFNQ